MVFPPQLVPHPLHWQTYVETLTNERVDFPLFARNTIINLHYPTQVHAMRLRVGADYDVPPNRVKDALHRAAESAEGVPGVYKGRSRVLSLSGRARRSGGTRVRPR